MNKKPTVNEFLNEFPSDIRILAENIRTIFKKTVPNHIESVYQGWHLIGYRAINGNKSKYFAFIAPYKGGIKLGFEYGVLLSDPRKKLQGNGNQVRFILINKQSDIKKKQIASFIWEAAIVANEIKFRKPGKK